MRSNVIVGFPGETEEDLQTLCDFLVAARMDVTGVFGYSDEDGTEAESFTDKLDEDEVWARAQHVTALVEELNAQRAEERLGEEVVVLVESVDDDGVAEGRAAHQGPEVDGTTRFDAPLAVRYAVARGRPRSGAGHRDRGRRPRGGGDRGRDDDRGHRLRRRATTTCPTR